MTAKPRTASSVVMRKEVVAGAASTRVKSAVHHRWEEAFVRGAEVGEGD